MGNRIDQKFEFNLYESIQRVSQECVWSVFTESQIIRCLKSVDIFNFL